jgi:hypothetical protein
MPCSDWVREAMRAYENTAHNMPYLWRWITIDTFGNVQKGGLKTQKELFDMVPEINPRFFDNFGVDELSVRQRNGSQIIIRRANSG